MESPHYMKQFKAAIDEARVNLLREPPEVIERFNSIVDEVSREHKAGLKAGMCGSSLENNIYHRLLAAGLVKAIEYK